jgi:hypothetical protein
MLGVYSFDYLFEAVHGVRHSKSPIILHITLPNISIIPNKNRTE